MLLQRNRYPFPGSNNHPMVGAVWSVFSVSSNWSGVKVTALSAKPFLKVSCCDSSLASSSPEKHFENMTV